MTASRPERGPRVLVSLPAGVVRGLAAHVGIFHLHSEQGAVGTHAQLVALVTLVEVHVSCRVGDPRGVEHHGAVEDDAVLLQTQRGKSHHRHRRGQYLTAFARVRSSFTAED